MWVTYPVCCASVAGAVVSKTVVSNQKRNLEFIVFAPVFYPPSQKATGLNPWMNARWVPSVALAKEGALRRVPPYEACGEVPRPPGRGAPLTTDHFSLRLIRLWRRLFTGNCYLISLLARASTSGGIVRPICFAVFRLTMNSNLTGCSTGRSAGLAPFRILSTKYATRR